MLPQIQSDLFATKKFEIQINGSKVDPTLVTDLLITTSIFSPSISASMCLTLQNDMFDRMKFDGNFKVEIFISDSNEIEYNEKFIAKNIVTNKISEYVVRAKVEMIDEFSFEAAKIIPCKGFKDVKLLDILQDSSMLSDLYGNYDKEQKFDTIDTEIKFYNIDSNKSAFSVQKELGPYFNALIFQNRKQFVIRKWENLFKEKVQQIAGEEITYMYPLISENFIFSIYDIKLNVADSTMVNALGEQSVYQYDPLKRSKKHFEYDIKKALGDMNYSEGEVKAENKGKRFMYQSTLDPEGSHKTKLQQSILFYSNAQFIVKGSFITNVGDIVNLSYEGLDGHESLNEGKWIITSITDKFVQGYYSSKITIARPSIAGGGGVAGAASSFGF